jgi:hypothetical protein
MAKNLEKKTEDDSFYSLVDGVRIGLYAFTALFALFLGSKVIKYTQLPPEQKQEVRQELGIELKDASPFNYEVSEKDFHNYLKMCAYTGH